VDLAYELFTSAAEPFPVQAQAWPCALSGMDVVAVAATGSGKTLAYLLPALVHVMAQPQLEPGEGPIALALVPTRELAQQTRGVAERFCERTRGEDTLRVGAVFGGVDASLHLPAEAAPDHGRWPELLVATPGRLLGLARGGKLSLRRASYVVVDEADLLLSPGPWLEQVRSALGLCRQGGQLFLASATWSPELQAVAEELCHGELVGFYVLPEVPPIPQDVRLFVGAEDAELARREALLAWLRSELRPEEAVLVLCANLTTARELAQHEELVGTFGQGGVGLLAEEAAGGQDRSQEYQRFVHGDLRMLVASFAAGARGLDYAETTAAAAEARRLSLAVLLFDFPRSIVEYIHCIGRTMRPGQRAGRAVAFMPEMRCWMAGELLLLLQRCGQPAPPPLEELVARDKAFLNECRTALSRLRAGVLPWPQAGSEAEDVADGAPAAAAAGSGILAACRVSPFAGSRFDTQRGLWTLAPSVPSYRRRLLHALADDLELPHVSTGRPPGRRLHLARAREALPEKFFMEGEAVEVLSRRRGEAPGRGRVTDPRIHPQRRTVRVRLEDGREALPCVDDLRLQPGLRS